MALGSISFVLFAFVLTVLSSPVPIPQASSTASSTGPSIAVPSNPITFGALTAPSLGGVFDDFKVAAPVHPDKAAPQAPHHVENRFLRPNSFRQKINAPATSRRTRRGRVGEFPGGFGCPPGVDCFKARDELNAPATSGGTRRASPASTFVNGPGCPPGIDCFKARDEPNAPANLKARASLADILSSEDPCPAGVDCFKVTEKPSQGGDEA